MHQKDVTVKSNQMGQSPQALEPLLPSDEVWPFCLTRGLGGGKKRQTANIANVIPCLESQLELSWIQ